MKSRPYEITDEAIEFEYREKINKIIIRMYRADYTVFLSVIPIICKTANNNTKNGNGNKER